MITRTLLAIAAALMLAPVVASAQVMKQFSTKDGVVEIDSKRGYIFYRTPMQAPMMFVREPNASDFAVWRGGRSAALATALKKYQGEYRDWQTAMKQWEALSPEARAAKPKPVKPLMPTEENFGYQTIEMATMTEGAVSPAFFKEKPIFGYLLKVFPGTYLVYGSILTAYDGNVTGVCMCMGTVKFEVRAGEIVDLGIFAVPGIAAGGKPPKQAAYAKPLPAEFRVFDGPLPERLRGLPVRRAEFRAAGKLPNYYGVTIDRLHPVPGVLSYRRDTIIDERTGLPLARQNGTVE